MDRWLLAFAAPPSGMGFSTNGTRSFLLIRMLPRSCDMRFLYQVTAVFISSRSAEVLLHDTVRIAHLEVAYHKMRGGLMTGAATIGCRQVDIATIGGRNL